MRRTVSLSLVIVPSASAWLTADEPKSLALTIPRNRMMHDSSVTSVAFSPDGKTLASGSEDRTIKLWDVSPSK